MYCTDVNIRCTAVQYNFHSLTPTPLSDTFTPRLFSHTHNDFSHPHLSLTHSHSHSHSHLYPQCFLTPTQPLSDTLTLIPTLHSSTALIRFYRRPSMVSDQSAPHKGDTDMRTDMDSKGKDMDPIGVAHRSGAFNRSV